jgi:hypothetical protein
VWWLLTLACGWHLGTPSLGALSVGTVSYTGPEPGGRALVERALATRLSEFGAGRGRPIRVDIEGNDAPEAAIPVDLGTVSWTWTWRVRFSVDDACQGDLVARRTFVVGPGDPVDPTVPRAEAARVLADEVAERIVASLLATPACGQLDSAHPEGE